MSYGKDTKKLLRKLNACESTLHISSLQIHSLPPLRDTLQTLIINNTQITNLPELPYNLRTLYCDSAPLTNLPELPQRLLHLDIQNTQITVLPRLPRTLITLYCDNTPLLVPRKEGESINSYRLRLDAWWDEQDRLAEEALSMERSQQRCREIKEALMMEMWHPRRVEKLIEMGGFEMLESF